MGDSACLLRSFSHPTASSSLDPQQVDPIRALTESVSFGRFMSEPLAWEKWSTFSHNRNLEEVEKFAKPGSVAQKRAFFESHYRKRAAMRAAALAGQANTPGDGSLHAENANPVSPSNTVPENAKTTIVGGEQQVNNLPDTSATEATGVTAPNPSNNGASPIILNSEKRSHEMSEQNVDEGIPPQVEVSTRLEKSDGQDMIVPTPDTNKSHNESADRKKSASSTKRRRTMSSRSSTDSGTSKVAVSCPMQMTPVQAKSGNNIVRIGQKSADTNNKRKMIPKALHTSINFTSCSLNAGKESIKMATSRHTLTKELKKMVDPNSLALPSNKKQSNSTLKYSAHGSRIGNNDIVASKESACSSNEKRTMVSKSSSKSVNYLAVSKSINFTSHAREFSRKAMKIPRESSALPQIPSRASFNAESKHPASDFLSEDRSCSKSPSVSKARTVTKSSPFRFKSEERAERRKEFFQKVEEKNNSMKTEKQNPQPRLKGKSCNSLDKLWPSSEAKLNEDLNRATMSPSSNQKKKIPLIRPWPAKAASQSSSRVQDVNSRPLPPRRPESSTYVGDKSRRRITSSVTSVPKIRQENASPNIQLSGSEGISCKHRNGGSVGS